MELQWKDDDNSDPPQDYLFKIGNHKKSVIGLEIVNLLNVMEIQRQKLRGDFVKPFLSFMIFDVSIIHSDMVHNFPSDKFVS
jgi:hypothetical protein